MHCPKKMSSAPRVTEMRLLAHTHRTRITPACQIHKGNRRLAYWGEELSVLGGGASEHWDGVRARGNARWMVLSFIFEEGDCVASGTPAKFGAYVFGDTAHITILLHAPNPQNLPGSGWLPGVVARCQHVAGLGGCRGLPGVCGAANVWGWLPVALPGVALPELDTPPTHTPTL